MFGQLWGCPLHNVRLEFLFETGLDRDLFL